MQGYGISNANPQEIPHSCAEPSIGFLLAESVSYN